VPRRVSRQPLVRAVRASGGGFTSAGCGLTRVTPDGRILDRERPLVNAMAHVAAHGLGAAAYAIRAVRAVAPESERDEAGRRECQWQRVQLPSEIRVLVLDDQRLRSEACWSLFDC
jgi:hypothetical protein